MIASEHLNTSTNLVTQVGGALALILFIILAAAWLLRRTGLRRSPQANATLQIKETHAIGQREKLLLIEINDRQLLLGVTAGHINCLASFDARPSAEATTEPGGVDFRSTLSNLLTGRKA